MQRRQKILVLSKFQRWFLYVFVAYTAVFLTIFGLGLFIWFRLVLQELLNVAGLLSPTFIATVQKHTVFAAVVLVVFLLVLLSVAAMQALLFSRRIAGPIFALARHLEKCAEKGRLEPIRLRQGDLFVDLAEKLNVLAEKTPSTRASDS